FSYDAVVQGYFDRFAETTEKKRGTQEVDSEFLKEIESWRELLAKNIALRNPDVSIYELNYVVQKLLDRLIFLRICEDRGIEPYGQLQTKAESGDVYTHLLNHFKLAESKYDSGIFDFDADKITPTLRIDDRVLKTIIQSLYYPKSPYEFSVLGVEILGNVYEQFLGKVIRLTAGHQAKVETKPEVKKAGGVYYTPQYIVDYIVKNTVGKLVEGKGKTPEEIAAIKILDPACGSGSFLIGAYTYLLRYHLDWYAENKPKKHKEAVFQVSENEWYLTTAEKKRILLNNIFGVDIDPQAVEVTKLSLLLKVLENESRESIDQQVKLGLEGVLPNLEGNIKCGNSLIGPDFYEAPQQATLFNEGEMRRINVFDWNDDVKGFGEIMKCGGFDCVIGNPPYGAAFDEQVKNYINSKCVHQDYQLDSYLVFMEQSFNLLKNEGYYGMIIPNTWLTNLLFKNIRKFVFSEKCVRDICHFKSRVFPNVTVDAEIVIIQNTLPENVQTHISILHKDGTETSHMAKQSRWKEASGDTVNIFITPEEQLLFDKVLSKSKRLDNFCKVVVGIKPYQTNKGKPKQTRETVKNRSFDASYKKDATYRQYLRGKDIGRFVISPLEERWISYGDWLAEPRYTANFDVPEKLMIRQTGDSLIACYDNQQFLCLNNMHVITPLDNGRNIKYFLGIINSRLLNFIYEIFNPEKGEALAEVKRTNVARLPVHDINFSNPTEKAQHDKLVALVDNILELQKKYHEARMEIDKGLYERQIKIADAQIDRLVYDLYGLTEEEVKVAKKNL
ncbi:MAG: N-6 DNA methylase, partial [Methanophagales archaeon]|nr:N-6 DNA methylase [Methanophagales archaeon]